MKSSKMKPSSLILILVIAKEELSYTGVVPATESPMPKSEGVNQKKLFQVCVNVFFVFLTPFSSEASVYIHLLAFFSLMSVGALKMTFIPSL